MKRAGRIVHLMLSGLSLLLLLATAGVWLRSYWVSDGMHWRPHPTVFDGFRRETIFQSSRGGLKVEVSKRRTYGIRVRGGPWNSLRYSLKTAEAYPRFETSEPSANQMNYHKYSALGFEYVSEATMSEAWEREPTQTIHFLTLPLYFLCVLFAVLPAHAFLRRRRRITQRIAQGCCIHCGYDLRASSGRCPECGNLPRGVA
jgi:hypothetical protein